MTPSCRAARATTGLNTEPGANTPLRARFNMGWFSSASRLL